MSVSAMNKTKLALAESLKELMKNKTFEKISVGEICNGCDMNRKSFYYHFKDKYDLVNWIFDTEISVDINYESNDDVWKMLTKLCMYFFENKAFYRKALQIRGQNSFSEYFRESLLPIIADRIMSVLKDKDIDFQVGFIGDAVVVAIQRWLIDNDKLTPEEFVSQIKLSIKYIAVRYMELNV